jgi:hypothetical protein
MGRTPFQGEDGIVQPFWQRGPAIASLLFTCLGLATGFFRSLNLAGGRIELSGFHIRIAWKNSALILFTLLTVAFPLSVLLRLTRSGWEIGNRLGTFISLGVCIVVAIAIAGLWQGRSMSRIRAISIASILTIMILGGFMIGWGPSAINYPYKVSADSRSVESLGISAAEWTRQWLGTGQRFGADRINRNLLAVYGRQIPVTSLSDQEGASEIPQVLFGKVFGSGEQENVRLAMIDYLMIDLRLTTALPALGVYFEFGEEPDIHAIPPEPTALLKFNAIKGISRPFDNGATIIYDMRSLNASY